MTNIEEKLKEKVGVTFNGSVTFNGPMFDIHDNQQVTVVSELPKGEEAKKASQTSTIPSELDNDKARNILQRFVDAGMLDGQFQPLVSRAQAALIANAVSMRLNIVKKWKVFESLWNRKNIRNDYNKAFSQTTVHKHLTKINSIVNG